MHVVIVGAGIIGSTLAASLAEAGQKVTLIDAKQPGHGTSQTSFAWLNANQKLPRGYFDLSVEGLDAWRDLAAGLGYPPWYQPTGSLELARDDDAKHELHKRLTRLRDWGYRAHTLTHEQVAELEPHLRLPADADVAYFSDEGHVLGRAAVEAIVERTAAAGVTVLPSTEVRRLTTTAGRVTGVDLASGDTISGDAVALCAGWQSVSLAAGIDVHLPLIPSEGDGAVPPCLVAYTGTIEPTPLARVLRTPDLITKPAGNRLHLEAEDIHNLTDLATTDTQATTRANIILQRARKVLPPLNTAQVDSTHICIRPMPVDGHPIVGRTPEAEGLYMIVTHSGITLAPALAKLAATEIANDTTIDQLAPYRQDRFHGDIVDVGDS
jgi:glycine/D-amino acid oxidase-like deaminating enzyme